MFWIIVFGILLLGLLFVMAEILFVPGGILGIVGILVILFGIYFGYANGGNAKGHIVLATTFLITLGAIVLAVRSKSWQKITLTTNLDQKYNANTGLKLEKGMAGIAITRLNPMGKALIENEEAEVISLDGFINEGVDIQIHKIEGSKIYIKLKS